MLTIARRCVPFTPFEKELSSAIVTLVSATGVYLDNQDPFPPEDPGDVSYRTFEGDTTIERMKITHHHYDHTEADKDPNIVARPYGWSLKIRSSFSAGRPRPSRLLVEK